MNKIQELRNKRLETWEKAKTFLEDKRDEKGIVSAEDTAAYEKMEEEVVDLGKEIDRLERQRDMDMKLSEAISRPVVGNPMQDKEDKTGRWKVTLIKKGTSGTLCAEKTPLLPCPCRFGTDSDGGRIWPDEF